MSAEPRQANVETLREWLILGVNSENRLPDDKILMLRDSSISDRADEVKSSRKVVEDPK